MYAWEKMFQKTALEKGKMEYEARRVTELKKDGDKYTAAVLDQKRHEVSITMQDGSPKRGKCDCPVAKGRQLCAHMAALLYTIEDEEKRQEKARQKEEEEKERRRLAREKRQEEKKRREIEKKQAEEARKRMAEEEAARKEAQRRAQEEQKAAEEARKAERRRLEEEARRRADERAKEEERQRMAQEREKIEEELQKEQSYSLLGDPWEEADEQNDFSIIDLENYQYFDIGRIRESVHFTADVLRKGRELFKSGAVKITKVRAGFDGQGGEVAGEIRTTVAEGGNETSQILQFSRTEVLHSWCGCQQCTRMYYRFYREDGENKCKYTAAAIDALELYLQTYKVADATDTKGWFVLDTLGGRENRNGKAAGENDGEKLKLEARLSEEWQGLEVSFRIGNNKMYVVKNLEDFCENVKESADAVYGKSTSYNHARSNFTEEGKLWADFIMKAVKDDEQSAERMQRRGYYYGTGRMSDRGIALYGWRLDAFFDTVSKAGGAEYDIGKSGKKKFAPLKARVQNPKITADISEAKIDGSKDFHGISVDVALPRLYSGVNADYYIEGGYLNRTDTGFSEKLGALAEQEENGHVKFRVGRNNLSTFYYDVLPKLKEAAEIREHSMEKIRQYLTPEVKFTFYLDADEGEVSCRVFAGYAQRKFSLVETMTQGMPTEPYRDAEREAGVLNTVLDWMPYVDEVKDALSTGTDEDRIYRVMTEGVDEILRLGEVRCTDSFRNKRVIRRVKARVGVSVSDGLLELEVSADGLEQRELLDLLQSYRKKKRYHRLKDGSYVGLDDTALETVDELVTALSLKPADMIKGKMHLPLYRALYLDRMLAENDELYSKRDAHFREMVKEFKTINDSEFEEPESLSSILRNYQKDGFKWLRTLEEWNLGGILADDMGLGKTLQVIALLLSAKQEGRSGTALVVAPAALVYNWDEEIRRFAPELSAAVIAGSQEERREKIGRYDRYDVLVTSYDTLRRDAPFYEGKEFRYEIIDEAQYIKNHTTAAAKAVKIIKSRNRFALTGTPIENRLSELWSIFDYLMPGFLYGYETFRTEIETPIVKHKDEDAVRRLQKMTGPFILRRLKENVLRDLPEKLEEIRYVRFEGEQKKLYDAQVLHMREMLAGQAEEDFNKNRFQVLAELTRLRQICCAPSLCFENYRGEAAKTDACVQLIQSAIDGGHRMLVFSQFTSMLEILENELDKEGIEYYVITGSTLKEERVRLVKEFNSGTVPVFFISLKAGGVGLNLTGADVVIHYDPWWNQAVQDQATDRAHRIGQTKKVTVYKLIAKSTIEEKIQKLQETKRDLADQIIGGGSGQLSGMSREDILALLEQE